jgi:hypothetical protein
VQWDRGRGSDRGGHRELLRGTADVATTETLSSPFET